MNNVVNFCKQKKQSGVFSLICAASIGLFGCGSDSSSSGPDATNDLCSVTKTGNSVTVKTAANGTATTTVYVFGADGNMVSQSTITDYSQMGDEVTAKAVCEASGTVEGFSATYEAGKCTVNQTVGLVGTLDEIYDAQNAVCEATNEVAKPASSSGSSESSSKSVKSLVELFQSPCAESNSGETVKVTGEKSDYICASIDLGMGMTTYTWAPAVSKIEDMDECSQSWAIANPQKTYAYDKSKKQIYTCSMDPESLTWKWSALGAALDIGDGDGDEDGDDDELGSSGSSKTNSSESSEPELSSSSGPREKVVTFEDGIMYTSTYGDRVRTFFNTVDEYTFFDDNKETKDSSGWWFSFDDSADGGYSSVFTGSEMGAYTAEIDLIYDWEYNGEYMEAVPYPYAAIGFNMSPSGTSVNMSDWEGMCVTYSATKKVAFTLKSFGDGRSSWYATLPSGTVKTVDLAFNTKTFHQPSWAIDQKISYPTFNGALSSVLAIHFKYSNDEAGVSCPVSLEGNCVTTSVNSIKIHKIGKYGACSN